jgi:hypothetical protein
MDAMIAWLIDYYAMATVMLVGAIVIMSRMRQPARRLAVGRSAAVGLALLAVLAALPGWPRAQWRDLPGVIRPDRASVPVVPVVNSGLVGPVQVIDEAGVLDASSSEQRMITIPDGQITSAISQVPGGGSITAATGRANGWKLTGQAFVAGGALMLAWLGIGFWQAGAMRRKSRPAPGWPRDLLARIVGDVQRVPTLLVSDRLTQPVAIGLWRPAIVLPERFVEEEPTQRIEAALAHEWAHFRNRDLWWIAFLGLLMPGLYAHPVYWWLRRRTREDQELLADDACAADGEMRALVLS